MRSPNRRLTLSIAGNINDIPAEEWNRIASNDLYSPFLEHEFLASVEATGCADPENGWYPRHFVLRSDERIIAAAPAYAKTHSMGEFVFDQGLAQAVMSMDKEYYPKLVATLPFTPSPGYRFLTDPEYDEFFLTQTLSEGMRAYRDEAGLASHSLLFADPAWETISFLARPEDRSVSPEGAASAPEGFLPWVHQFFLWENDSYRSFDDYLARFNKNQRRNIRRERQSVAESGLCVEALTGSALTEAAMDRMFEFYRSTNENFGPWAAFFLNREWFHHIGRRWSHRVILFSAIRPENGSTVAMSMLVRKGTRLIGRYWGASEHVPNLHFELCYYAPIEFAVAEGIESFDPGMGSPHKARRGFRSREFISYHSFADAGNSALFAAVLLRANRGERELIRELNESIPWKVDNTNLTLD